MSIVALLVFTMILAVFEFGLLFRDNLSAADAVADATRIGAIVGPDVQDDRTADFEIVRSLREGMSALGDSSVRAIVIFKASGSGAAPESEVLDTCRAGNSVRGICNVYDGMTAFRAVEFGNHSYFMCDDPGGAEIACHWDPQQRKDGPRPSDVETLGVYVRIERDGFTGLFADTWTITRAAKARLEPGVES